MSNAITYHHILKHLSPFKFQILHVVPAKFATGTLGDVSKKVFVLETTAEATATAKDYGENYDSIISTLSGAPSLEFITISSYYIVFVFSHCNM